MSASVTRLQLHVGDERSLELLGLGTAGYVWDEELDGEPGVVEVTFTRGRPPDAPPMAVGASAPERAMIRAIRPGTAVVTLVHRRRWEPPERARARRVVEVTVS
jgi:predicted secreted protein